MLQTCCLGIVRSKIDAVFELFDWTEEEKDYLRELSCKGSSVKGSFKHRQCRHLTYTLAIAPSYNLMANPTGEWELKYFEE